jgi:hypothetical protein
MKILDKFDMVCKKINDPQNDRDNILFSSQYMSNLKMKRGFYENISN